MEDPTFAPFRPFIIRFAGFNTRKFYANTSTIPSHVSTESIQPLQTKTMSFFIILHTNFECVVRVTIETLFLDTPNWLTLFIRLLKIGNV